MTATEIDSRIFVVGVPRSGTTLMQSLLATHSAVTSFTESHFFSRYFRLVPFVSTPILVKSPEARLNEFLAENGVDSVSAAALLRAAGMNRRSDLLSPRHARAVTRQFLGLLDRLTLQRGRSSWIEKTPRHLRYVPFLERVSGSECRTCFIHVIREGLDVVASLHLASQNWERPYDLETCVNRWNDDVGFSLGRIGSPHDYFVFYEELTADPESALRDLVAKLQLDWQPDILTRYAPTSEPLMTEEETWKANVGRSVRRSTGSAGLLTQAQRDQIATQLDPDLYRTLHEAARAEGRQVAR